MDTPESLVGQVLSRSYRLEGLLAEGGASLIFEAERQRPPRRRVVVKLLHPLLTGDDEMVARFNQEAEILGELHHVNAVELLDVGHTDDDLPFHVLELLKGETLRQRLDRQGPLSAKEVGRIVTEAAGALQALHERRVVHRDVNPRNLFKQEGSGVKLMDLGLALRLSGQERRGEPEVIGSEGYMSPEQFRGEVHETTAATDVFALAVVTYEALSGKLPFQAEDADELLRQVCNADPTPITARVKGLPPAVNKVLARAMAKAPEERFASIDAFASDLGRVLDKTSHAPAPAADHGPPSSTESQQTAPSDPAPRDEETSAPSAAVVPLPEPPPPDHRPEVPSPSSTPTPEPPEVETRPDPSLAGQTLLGEDDLLDELLGAGEPAPEEDAPPEPSPLDGQTLMDGDLDVGPGVNLLGGQTIMDDGPQIGTENEQSEQPTEIDQRDASLAGQTLLGEDDLLDELASAGGEGAPGQEHEDPLAGQTIMDEVASLEPEAVDEPPAPKSQRPKVGEIVTVFKGEAWDLAEKRARREPPPTAEPAAPAEPTVAIPKRPASRVLPVAITIGVVVALAVVLYLLAR